MQPCRVFSSCLARATIIDSNSFRSSRRISPSVVWCNASRYSAWRCSEVSTALAAFGRGATDFTRGLADIEVLEDLAGLGLVLAFISFGTKTFLAAINSLLASRQVI